MINLSYSLIVLHSANIKYKLKNEQTDFTISFMITL